MTVFLVPSRPTVVLILPWLRLSSLVTPFVPRGRLVLPTAVNIPLPVLTAPTTRRPAHNSATNLRTPLLSTTPGRVPFVRMRTPPLPSQTRSRSSCIIVAKALLLRTVRYTGQHIFLGLNNPPRRREYTPAALTATLPCYTTNTTSLVLPANTLGKW